MTNEFGIAGLANVERYGAGGNAVVYLAKQPELDRTVILKLINRGEDEATERRFERERRAMGRLSQVSGIAPVYDSGFSSDGRPYLIMPFYPAGSLWDLIVRSGSLSPERVRGIGISVAKALHTAHEHGVIHRDIKPGNILIDNDGNPQIADFGIAQLLDSDGGTSVTLTITALYTAPEVMAGHTSDVASDVYSLGSTLYTALAGSGAYAVDSDTESVLLIFKRVATEDPPPLDPAIPLALRNTIMKAMSRDPALRHQSCAELAAELEQIGPLTNEVVQPNIVAERPTSVLTAEQQASLSQSALGLGGPSPSDLSEPDVDRSHPKASNMRYIAAVLLILALAITVFFATRATRSQSVETTDGDSQTETVANGEDTPGQTSGSDISDTSSSSGKSATSQGSGSAGSTDGSDGAGSGSDSGAAESSGLASTAVALPTATPTPTAGERAITGIGRYSSTAYLHSCKGVKKVPATLMPAAPGSLDGDGSLVFSADFSTWWVELDSTVEVFDEALPNLTSGVIQMDTGSLVNLADLGSVGDMVYLPSMGSDVIEAELVASDTFPDDLVISVSGPAGSDGDSVLLPGQAVATSEGELLGYVARNAAGEFHVSRLLISEPNGELDFGECGQRSADDYQYLAQDWQNEELPEAVSQLLLIQNLIESYTANDWDMVREIESTQRSDVELSAGWQYAEQSYVIARAKGNVNPRGTAEWAVGVATYEDVDGELQTRFSCYKPRVNTGKGNAVLGAAEESTTLALSSFPHLNDLRTPEPNILKTHVDIEDMFLLTAYSCAAG